MHFVRRILQSIRCHLGSFSMHPFNCNLTITSINVDMVQNCAQSFGDRPYLSQQVNSCLIDGEAFKKLFTPDREEIIMFFNETHN